MRYEEEFHTLTDEAWEHIPAGTEVESGFSYTLTAPNEEGTYTLYEAVYEGTNTHAGWKWVKET